MRLAGLLPYDVSVMFARGWSQLRVVVWSVVREGKIDLAICTIVVLFLCTSSRYLVPQITSLAPLRAPSHPASRSSILHPPSSISILHPPSPSSIQLTSNLQPLATLPPQTTETTPETMMVHHSIVGALRLLSIIFASQKSYYVHATQRQAFVARPHYYKPSLPLLSSPFHKKFVTSYESFCPCPYYLHRSERRKYAPLPIPSTSTSSGILADCKNICEGASGRKDADRKSTLRLNQRKLPKEIVRCRTDVKKALHILGDAYPHLSISLEQNEEFDALKGLELSYEQLLGILGGRGHNSAGPDTRTVTLDDTLIIDGKSTVAALDVLRKNRNLPVALHLLRLSVEGAHYNRKMRQLLAPENENDCNELRRVYKAMFSLLGHTNQQQEGSSYPRLIIYLLRHHMSKTAQIQPGSEMYHAAINTLGKFGECGLILEILGEMEQSHETKINAEIGTLTTSAPAVDRMAYQTAISSLARHGHCREATRLYYRMQSKGFEQPDMNIYNELLIGIAKEAGRSTDINCIANGGVAGGSDNNSSKPLHKVALEILHEMKTKNRQPTEQTFNSVISACGKEGAWDDAARVAEEARNVAIEVRSYYGGRANERDVVENVITNENTCVQSTDIEYSVNIMQESSSTYFQNLQCFHQVGRGKNAWWEIGRYSVSDDKYETDDAVNGNSEDNNKNSSPQVRSIVIGIHPHRNPVSNGLSIVFFDETRQVKLGRMLLKNASSRQPGKTNNQAQQHYYSSLVGMEVNKSRRGEGLSKVFVAIWLRICLETNAYPRAAVMNKPLISYVLMGTFNFMPQNGGSRVELIRLKRDENSIDGNNDGYNPQFGLYSPSAKSLQGLFSQRVLRTQNIAILDQRPSSASCERGATIYLKTKFEHPMAIEENAVNYTPPPLLQKENMVDMLFGADQIEANQTNVQRTMLDRQIHFILKTNGTNGTIAPCKLEIFTNSTLLKKAFLSYVSNYAE
ncbi:hypothetical protein ACHAXR_012571 [Thalassiosira sp. AJA248-18]